MIALLFATTLAAAVPLPVGKLCIDDRPCNATEGTAARVEAAAEPRRFVWTADDRSAVTVGIIDAGATAVALDAGTVRPLRMRGPAQTEVAFEIVSASSRWRWTVAKPPPSFRLIHPPCADCVLSAQANGFRKFEKQLGEVRDVVLHPFPRLRGRVADRKTDAPLPGATITASDILIAKTDANGHFDAAIEQKWPQAVAVQFPGRAPRRVAVPRAPADTELPTIALSAGGALRVTIETPMPEKLTWELRDPASRDLLRQGTVEPSATLVVVDGVGEGKQSFVIRGSRPLQQFDTLVNIEPEQVTEASISIEPGTLNLEVKRGSTPFAHAKAKVGMFGERWEGEITLDEDGRASEELWQRGKMSAALYRNNRIIYVAVMDVASEEETWRITVPDRRVTGTITDAATGAPLREAEVSIWINTAEDAGMRVASTDAEGRFTFDGIVAGTHELKARHEGYALTEGNMVAVGQADGDYTRDLRLRSRNSGRALVAIDDRGLPVADALVIVAGSNGIRETGITAIDGTASVPVGVAERGMVFVIPRSGSFAFTSFGPRTEGDDTIEVHVRAGSATIEVETHDADGKPLADVFLGRTRRWIDAATRHHRRAS